MLWVPLHLMALAHFGAERYEAAVDWAKRSLQHRPDGIVARAWLAASLGQLGRESETGAVASSPPAGFSVAGIRRALSGAEPSLIDRVLEGLRKAGWELKE